MFTDNPHGDKVFFTDKFPSSINYDHFTPAFDANSTDCDNGNSINNATAIESATDQNCIKVISNNLDTNTFCDALREELHKMENEHRAVGIDCEWDVHKNEDGYVIGTSKVCTCQIAHMTVDNE